MTVYCDITLLKDRLLIGVNDTQYDDALNNAVNEASRLVDLFLKPYTNVPLNDADEQIEAITADFGASIFKRRMLPDEVRMRGTDILQPDLGAVDATGWFALALRKIEQYIKNYYVLTQAFAENGSTVHNPRLYLQMLKEGIITGKEARQMMDTATIETIKEIQELTKTLITNETITLSKEVSDILNQTVNRELTTNDTQNISKTIVDTVNDTLHKIYTDNETISIEKTLTQILNDTITQTISIDKTLATNETLTTNETVSEYKTKRQKSFVFIKSDEDSGYEVE